MKMKAILTTLLLCVTCYNSMAMNDDDIDEKFNVTDIEQKKLTDSSSTIDESLYDLLDELEPSKLKLLNYDDQLDKAFEYLSVANGSDYNESAFYYIAAKWLDSRNQNICSYLQYVGFKEDLDELKLDNSKSWPEKKALLIKKAEKLSFLMKNKFE